MPAPLVIGAVAVLWIGFVVFALCIARMARGN
jgi:hypothetical protein